MSTTPRSATYVLNHLLEGSPSERKARTHAFLAGEELIQEKQRRKELVDHKKRVVHLAWGLTPTMGGPWMDKQASEE